MNAKKYAANVADVVDETAVLIIIHNPIAVCNPITGLSPVSEAIIRRRNSLFGHVTRLAEDTLAHQASRCHVDMTLGRFPDRSWRRRPGRPRNRWLD